MQVFWCVIYVHERNVPVHRLLTTLRTPTEKSTIRQNIWDIERRAQAYMTSTSELAAATSSVKGILMK